MTTSSQRLYKLLILLPKNRTIAGHAICLGPHGETLFNCEALGKADGQRAIAENNVGRLSTLPYGDTPLGDYRPSRVISLSPRHPRIGDLWIPLEGETGNALSAMENGRRGLGIHAGRGDSRLVPTFGCIRLRDSDLQHIHSLAHDNQFKISIEEI